MMQEARYYLRKEDNTVQCRVCPRNCIIKDGEKGFCRARENKRGRLFSLVYGIPCSVNVDPIEKKPLFHFLPGTEVLSLGTTGCNLICRYCQNWQISQAFPSDVPLIRLNPKDAVKEAAKNGCRSIAYTYTEPSVFFEYVADTAKEARKKGLKNIIITNGFVNIAPLKAMCKVIDAANVDLKSFSDDFYRKYTGAWLDPVLETLKILKKENIWLEITYLLIPGLNEDMDDIYKMCRWIEENLGKEVPLHFSRFFPDYLMKDISSTKEKILVRAKEAAERAGLEHIYLGNIKTKKAGDTYCPKCGKKVIDREGFLVRKNFLKEGKCSCKTEIAGIWK